MHFSLARVTAYLKSGYPSHFCGYSPRCADLGPSGWWGVDIPGPACPGKLAFKVSVRNLAAAAWLMPARRCGESGVADFEGSGP